MSYDVEATVRERYAAAAGAPEAALCCRVEYDENLLRVIPPEVLAVDYGCGDPTRYVRAGETVLDLGSGSGKTCFMAAQVVGAEGRVLGVDFTDDMLAIARRHQGTVAERLGYANVTFLRGRIQDLATSLDEVDEYLGRRPLASLADLDAFERFRRTQRQERPLVADASVDVVISSCVLNLVDDAEKQALFAEIHRILRRGGRAMLSDIVSDEPVPAHLKADPELWSGCISGALQESEFLAALARAGFYGIEILERGTTPWRTVEGIEFRAVTVAAYKGKEGPCWDANQAVIYRGPWREVRDDDGHTLVRGVPMAVCEKTFALYTREPYARDIIPLPPHVAVPPDAYRPFDCARDAARSPRETKGERYAVTTEASGACCPTGTC
ncbi:MAG: methyltransferase domain-containing protein [Deltaproteobacteria bacterium]|nr:methyltransferase domain-containing protein [Deltaproteobacteria bacterium]